ncbi:MAG: hypothetical protein C4583_14690 [Anaerolineaceae bacterium]|nr:MAG: hypothetical protein C4583_14690 [Anaerolineaceae bacterium]
MNPIPEFGSYDEIEKKMLQRVRAAKLDEKILAIVQAKYEEELAQRNVILSRPDRKRLYQTVVKAVLDDVLGKLGE